MNFFHSNSYTATCFNALTALKIKRNFHSVSEVFTLSVEILPIFKILAHGYLMFSVVPVRQYIYLPFFATRKRSLGQGNVYTPVCQSFCSKGEIGFPTCTGKRGGFPACTGKGGGFPACTGTGKTGWYASYWNAFLFFLSTWVAVRDETLNHLTLASGGSKVSAPGFLPYHTDNILSFPRAFPIIKTNIRGQRYLLGFSSPFPARNIISSI